MTGRSDVLGAAAGAALLAAAVRGEARDELGVGAGRPVLVVDVTGTAPFDVAPPATLATVVVAVDRHGQAPVPAGADVALSAAGAQRGRPWVEVGDPLAAALALAGRVERAPQAATTLVQVLRVGPDLPVDAAVVVESLAYSTLQAGPEHRRWLDGRPVPGPRTSVRPAVIVERHGDLLDVVIDRPERRNALGVDVRDGLVDALNLVALDPSIERVTLSGAGSNFCSGGDLGEFGTGPDPAQAHAVRLARHVGLAVHAVAARATVHLHGPCLGAGVELAAFADDVVADPATTLALPEVGMGLVPGAGGTVSIPRRIGRARAAWLALSGEALGAATALRWGLVDHLA